MIKHLFKLIWNQKRKNALLILEIFISFLVLFAVMSLLLYQMENYQRPLGFQYEDVWVVNLNFSLEKDSLMEEQQTQLKNQLLSYPEVLKATYSNANVPFSMSKNNSMLIHENQRTMADMFMVDEHYPEVLNINLVEGQWFTMADTIGKHPPIVISRHLSETFFGDENAIGKLIDRGEQNTYRVVGVVDHFKYRDFESVEDCAFIPYNPGIVFQSVLIMKMQKGLGAEYEALLSRRIGNILKGQQNDIEQLSVKKASQIKFVLIPIILLLTVCGFLIFNVVLGLFGILWYNINKRKNEIGLRRALGASQQSISRQFIGEILFIASLGIVLGVFFAIQFPILQVFGLAQAVYMKAIFIASLLIYAIVAVCAFYPSKQASEIHPALALHQD